MSALTLVQLRRFKGFENVSDDEGAFIINVLHRFSVLAYRFFTLQKLEYEN